VNFRHQKQKSSSGIRNGKKVVTLYGGKKITSLITIVDGHFLFNRSMPRRVYILEKEGQLDGSLINFKVFSFSLSFSRSFSLSRIFLFRVCVDTT
jgi:hypothetical protein